VSSLPQVPARESVQSFGSAISALGATNVVVVLEVAG
jgi:hypothetical protein